MFVRFITLTKLFPSNPAKPLLSNTLQSKADISSSCSPDSPPLGQSASPALATTAAGACHRRLTIDVAAFAAFPVHIVGYIEQYVPHRIDKASCGEKVRCVL